MLHELHKITEVENRRDKSGLLNPWAGMYVNGGIANSMTSIMIHGVVEVQRVIGELHSLKYKLISCGSTYLSVWYSF